MTRNTSPRMGAGRTTLAVATAFAMLASEATASLSRRATKSVPAGQTIQSVIDAARSGDKIIVPAGTYKEQLVIKKSGITLIGTGAILSPPDTYVANDCTGLALGSTQAGVCVYGDVVLGTPGTEHATVSSVNTPVKGFSISGFKIKGFSGINIALVGAKDATVSGNQIIDGGVYGLLSVGSSNTVARGNVVSSTLTTLPLVAMGMDDKAPSHFTSNEVSGYTKGLAVETAGGDVQSNSIKKNCIGVQIYAGVKNAKVQSNLVGATNPSCAAAGPNSGILIDGAITSTVQNNQVTAQVLGGAAAGLTIQDNTVLPSPATGNIVKQNVLKGNDVDLVISAVSPTNMISMNVCKTSTPTGKCVLA
jgi:parallel beta-helix repeat protein